MTDRQLLEDAARAAGVRWRVETTETGQRAAETFGLWLELDGEPYEGQRRRFNPLTNYDDAMRIAAKLKLVVDFFEGEVIGAWSTERFEPGNADQACEAITRAAAEIGRNLGEQT